MQEKRYSTQAIIKSVEEYNCSKYVLIKYEVANG